MLQRHTHGDLRQKMPRTGINLSSFDQVRQESDVPQRFISLKLNLVLHLKHTNPSSLILIENFLTKQAFHPSCSELPANELAPLSGCAPHTLTSYAYFT